MHRMLIILTLTFIEGHTYLNHEHNKCLNILETIQAMPIEFAVKVVRLKVHMAIVSPMTLTFIQGHKFVSNLTNLYLAIYRTICKAITFKIGTTVDLWMPYMLILV